MRRLFMKLPFLTKEPMCNLVKDAKMIILSSTTASIVRFAIGAFLRMITKTRMGRSAKNAVISDLLIL
jgi:hypothetical protein